MQLGFVHWVCLNGNLLALWCCCSVVAQIVGILVNFDANFEICI
jgi:hypothetical protein